MKGLVHIYTGNGKGKTSSAVGLGIRACGRGLKVLMVQFLKGMETGEMIIIKRLEPDFVIKRGTEIKKFTWNMNEEELKQVKEDQQAIFSYAVAEALNKRCDVLILDEVMAAITTGMLSLEQVADFVKNKPEELELVLTGRDAPEELIRLADYVSVIDALKHPMEKGIPARKGIEF